MNKEIDVMLINPYDENALKNALGFIAPPMNLMYLASSLEKESYSVKIVDDDLLQKGYKHVSEMADKLNPQVVAVTATTSTINSGLKYLDAHLPVLVQLFNISWTAFPNQFTPLLKVNWKNLT